jgi:hypothetical protein
MEKLTNVKALEYVINADFFTEIPEDIQEKLTAIRDSYVKKASGNRKPTARQTANVQLRADIKDAVLAADAAVTASEVLAVVKANDYGEEITLPRVSAQLTALVKDKEIDRFVDKKKAFFKAL